MIGGRGIEVCLVSAEDSTATRRRLMSHVEAPMPLAKGKKGGRHDGWSMSVGLSVAHSL